MLIHAEGVTLLCIGTPTVSAHLLHISKCTLKCCHNSRKIYTLFLISFSLSIPLKIISTDSISNDILMASSCLFFFNIPSTMELVFCWVLAHSLSIHRILKCFSGILKVLSILILVPLARSYKFAHLLLLTGHWKGFSQTWPPHLYSVQLWLIFYRQAFPLISQVIIKKYGHN